MYKAFSTSEKLSFHFLLTGNRPVGLDGDFISLETSTKQREKDSRNQENERVGINEIVQIHMNPGAR